MSEREEELVKKERSESLFCVRKRERDRETEREIEREVRERERD